MVLKTLVQNQKSKCLKILVLQQQSKLLPSDLSLHQPLNVKINQDSMLHKDLRRKQTCMQCKVGIPKVYTLQFHLKGLG
jgi:hypothetical protein